jgi:hypothetical protein
VVLYIDPDDFDQAFSVSNSLIEPKSDSTVVDQYRTSEHGDYRAIATLWPIGHKCASADSPPVPPPVISTNAYADGQSPDFEAYYKDFGIAPFLAKNMTSSTASKLKALKLCGVSMEAMVGARAECGIRHQIREVINKDFKSQYPTINIKLGLQDLLLAARVETFEDECTASGDWLSGGKDAAFLESVSILDMDDGSGDDPYIFGSNAAARKR